MWSLMLVLMGVSWHRSNSSASPYFWLLIALLGLLTPLECAHWRATHHFIMALTLVLTAWLAYHLHDALLVVAAVWMLYEMYCILS